jgi:hypothetical protein
MRIRTLLLILCVILAGCGREAPAAEPELIPLFRADFAYNFTDEDLKGRTPVFFDCGDERMERVIFLSDTDLYDLEFYRWGGWDVIDEEVYAYIGGFLFEAESLSPEYYIDFLPPLPLNNDSTVIMFKDSSGEEHSYTLGVSPKDGTLTYGRVRIAENEFTEDALPRIPTYTADFATRFTEEDLQGRTAARYSHGDSDLVPIIFLSNREFLHFSVYSDGYFIDDGEHDWQNGLYLDEEDLVFHEWYLSPEYYIEFTPADEDKIYYVIFRFTDECPLSSFPAYVMTYDNVLLTEVKLARSPLPLGMTGN